MENNSWIQDLKEILPTSNILTSEPLSKYTYIKTGGNAEVLVFPETIEELQKLLRFANEQTVPVTVLGYGSNVIIKDSGLKGICISLKNFEAVSIDGTTVKALAGASLIEVCKKVVPFELTGLEFACGIPGTIGGALVMNAGAYGGEISHVLKAATVITQQGEIITLHEGEFQFGYRKSVFAKENYVVLEAEFGLQVGVKSDIEEKMAELTFQRESKQPLEYPSCGSVFKRPPNHFAGKLIQDSGLQGTRIGGAEVSTKHAGFIVNVDNATSTDYLDLIKYVQKTVKEKFDIELEREVKVLG